MLQFITSTSSSTPILEQIKSVLEGGCKWIQLRMKEADDEQIKALVEQAMPLCKKHEALFILNDRVELAKELGMDGVHIGQSDMPVTQARQILGAAPIIGVTANTIDQIRNLASIDIDYIGVGPFRYTETKKNLAPTLGLEGYADIKEAMLINNIEVPIVAVGGILESDIEQLMNCGINGIAVSGAIANAKNITQTTSQFIDKLNEYNSL